MLLVRGGTVVNPGGSRAADVLLDGEEIVAVDPDLDPTGHEVIDAGGALVLPGAIEVHTHLDLPVGTVRSADDFSSGTIAAGCGGTTTVIDFAGAGREPPDEALREWRAKADGRAAIDYGLHLTVTEVPEDPSEALEWSHWFVDEDVTSVKLHLAYPERLMVDEATLRRALVAAREAGVLVCVHAEGRVGGRAPNRGGARAWPDGAVGVVEPRPPGIDAAEISQDFLCTPPVRTDADRSALWEGLAGGDLDAVATDHCPFTTADRRRGVLAGG